MRHAILMLLFAGAAAGAGAAPGTSAEPGDGCVEVEVNGRKEQSVSCLGRLLQPAPPAQGAGRPAAPLSATAIAERPSNQLGLYNRAALAHRMGNNFGRSVTPQRPAPAPAAGALLPAR